MPPASQVKGGEALLARVLIYGPAKTKKSWWALAAGATGFNHLYVDGENYRHVVGNIPDAILRRTLIVDVKDETGRFIFHDFLVLLLKGQPFLWDEQAKARLPTGRTPDPTHAHIWFDMTKLSANDLFTLDSYTGLTDSVREQNAETIKVDLSNGGEAVDARDSGEMRSIYMMDGVALTWALNNLTKFKCHLIVVGHKDTYEKRDKDGKKVIWQREQIKSSSGPHAGVIAKLFSDILRFFLVGTGHRISTEASSDFDGGSRTLPPKTYKWEELTFKDYCVASGIKLPAADAPRSSAFIYFPPGEIPDWWIKPNGDLAKPASANAPLTKITGAVTLPNGKPQLGTLPKLLPAKKG